MSRGTLAQRVAEELTQQIVDERWQVGQLIGSEAELLKRFNVSRSVLREAIRVLEHHQIARMRRGPGGGLSIRDPNSAAAVRAMALNLDFLGARPADVFETRALLELRAVELAAKHIDETGIVRLRAVVAAERRPDHTCSLAPHEIHHVLAEVSGNPAFKLFIDMLARLTVVSRPAGLSRRTQSEIHRAHQLIADAVVAGDAALARHVLRAHLTAVGSMPLRSKPAA
jgi:DNA-binding FadR family transcriptional regulator